MDSAELASNLLEHLQACDDATAAGLALATALAVTADRTDDPNQWLAAVVRAASIALDATEDEIEAVGVMYLRDDSEGEA